ncbi:unnamed protein product [Scytosiphon promiscuus]
MRSVRYTSNSNASKGTSSSCSCSCGDTSGRIANGGIGSDTLEGSRSSIATRNSSGNTTTSSENSSSPRVPPCHDHPLPSVQAAVMIATPPAVASAGPTCNSESPARPPSPLPSPPLSPTSRPQAQITLPSMRGSRPDPGSGSIEPPTASTPEGEQPQPHFDDHRQQQSANSFPGPGAGACHHRHPLDAWRTSALNLLKLLFLFDAGGAEDRRARHHHNGGGGGRNRAATEDCLGVATAAAAARPRRPSEPVCRPPSPPPPKARVRFSHQIRVILVASRLEMSAVKADVWWADKDYSDFRRAYLITAREERESNRERELDLRRRKAEGLLEEVRSEARPQEPTAPQPPLPLPSTKTTVADEAGDAGRTAAATGTHDRGGDDDGVSDGDDLFARPPDGGGEGDGGSEDNDLESGHNSRLLRTVSPRLPPPPSPESKPRTPPPRGSMPPAPLAAATAAVAAEGDGPVSGDAKVLDDPRAAAPAADVAAGVGREPGRKVGAVVDLDTTGLKKRAPFATAAATASPGPSWAGASGGPQLLGAGKDLRIDPRTGGRIPLPFLGDTPIRRVASF